MCFFELDNTATSQNLENQLNKNEQNVETHSYSIPKGTKGKQAFERMIKEMSGKGKKCDSLVISGHHTGDWFGTEGKGVLWLKDMEALSCKKEYREWFENIKALWLDGCNTVTDNFIKPWKSNTSGKKNPDSATVKYFDDQSGMDKRDMELYQQSYSGSLDEKSPLSSRYLRMFPNTQIYGFNGSAPSAIQKYGQSFIFKHLTDLGKALRTEREVAKARTDFDIALNTLFSDDFCDEESLEAWENVSGQAEFEAIEHQDYKRAKKLGCDLILAKQLLDDPNSKEAQKNLARQILSDPKYKKTKALELANEILNKSNSEKAIQLAKHSLVETLKEINREDKSIPEKKHKYSHLLFNNLYDTWNTAKKYKTKDGDFFEAVRAEFQDESFTKSVEERIKSPITASLRKGDYIKLYTEVHDIDISKNDFVRKHIEELLTKANKVFKGSIVGKEVPKRALAVSVVDQLFQYDFLNKEQMEKLRDNKKLFPPNTKNPFIKDTWTKLKFTLDPGQVIPTIQKASAGSLSKKSAIRIGAGLYLKKKPRFAKKTLAKIAEEIEVKLGAEEDSQAFFQALHSQLSGQSMEKQADILLELSFKTTENLEELVITYANMVLEEGAVRDKFCKKIVKQFGNLNRSGFMIENCP